jgi:hypothetical protein
VVQTVTSSVIYSSGSNVFGNNIANTQRMTGSVTVTGSLAVVTNGTEFQVTSTGVNLGNALTDSHIISGSLRVNPSGLFVSSSGNVGIGTSSPNTYTIAPQLVVDSGANGGGLTIKTGTTSSTTNYGGVFFADGTTGSEQYRGFIQYSHNFNTLSDCLILGTAGTEKMYITSTGNVGIGTSSPANKLDVRAASATIDNYQTIHAFSTDSAAIDKGGGIALGGYYNGTTSIAMFGSIVGRKANGTSGNYDGYLAFGTNAQATGVVERMRISSNTYGTLLAVGTDTPTNGGSAASWITINGSTAGSYSGGLAFAYNSAAKVYQFFDNNNFYVQNGANGVYLTRDGSSWSSVSDERLKNITSNINNAVEKLMTLRTVNFSWKSDNTNKENLGLIAQDVEKVFPQVIDKTKLSIGINSNTDNNEYLGVRYQDLVPVLIAAIQEQQAQIDELKSLINK